MLQYLEKNWVKVWGIRNRGDRCLVKSVKIMWWRKGGLLKMHIDCGMIMDIGVQEWNIW